MEEMNTRTHVHAHDAATTPPSFGLFIALFTQHCGNSTPYQRNDAHELWSKCSDAKKIQLCNALRSKAFTRPRPDWCINDFPEPQPTDYNGATLMPDAPLVVARYNGCAGIFTQTDAQLFHMDILRPFKQ